MERVRRWGGIGVVIVVTAVLSAAGAGYASHQFADEPDGSFFHDSIGAIVDAGCASGFNDNTFKAGQAPNRGQFAYWTNNCGSQIVEASTAEITPIPGTPTELLAVTVDVQGATPGAKQFVRVDAVFTYGCEEEDLSAASGQRDVGLAGGGPPLGGNECRVQFAVVDDPLAPPPLSHSDVLRRLGDTSMENGPAGAAVPAGDTGTVGSDISATVSASKVFEVPPGEETFYLMAVGEAGVAVDVQAEARSITAHVAPFGSIDAYTPPPVTAPG